VHENSSPFSFVGINVPEVLRDIAVRLGIIRTKLGVLIVFFMDKWIELFVIL
jgi:hypothetical protein